MTTLVRRALARRDAAPDAGVAMVVVLGVMLVGAIITTTLAMVTMFNTRNTLENRVEMRALQSADAGLDLMLSLFEGKKYSELAGVCSRDFVINNDQVHVETSFMVVGSAVPVACPAPTDVTTSVTVQSTATTSVVPLSGEAVTRTVAATFAPTPPEVLLDKAIFSEGSVTLTNNMEILASGALDAGGQPVYDANVYANGYVACKTQSAVGGSIYAAQSYVLLENQCGVKSTVWAKDYVRMSSGVSVEGDVYAAAITPYNSGVAYGVYLENSNARITGAAITNASIHLQDGASIGGAAYSRTGQIDFSNNGSVIGGSAYAVTKLAFNNGGKVAGNAYVSGGTITSSNSGTIVGDARASGTITGPVTAANKYPSQPFVMPTTLAPHPNLPPSLGFPGILQPPPREQMPQLNLSVSSGERDKWTNAGWAPVTLMASECSGKSLVNKINSLTGSPSIVYFDNCTSTPTIDNATLNLQVDVALVLPRGLTSNNQLTVKSSDATQVRKLYLMTPADAAGVSWVTAAGTQTSPTCTSPAANISINKAQKIESVEWFIYTPCAVNWSNGIQAGRFVGQIYAGSVSLLSNFPMTMKTAPVPSLSTVVPSVADPAKLTMSSRFDVRG